MKWLLLSACILLGCCNKLTESSTIKQGNYTTGQEDEEEEEETQKGNTDTSGELWALLVAGSSGWYNYRHQADVCHAYQILHQHGVPDDHIIVMMYDDIGNNIMNPNPGVIINRPNGPNVYEGILKDYTGDEVTPENFLNILTGNASAMNGIGSGKVVRSNSSDRIFINLVDHGAPGLFAFPNAVLHATTLVNTVLKLRQDDKFLDMVIYVEACESGSMFKQLIPDDIRVYAVSASSPHQPSYACYMDEELDTYLGDVFSVKWMEDTDREDVYKETLRQQFHLVRMEVTTSTVMQWGQHDINKEKLWQFMGEKDPPMMNSIYYHIDDEEDESITIHELNRNTSINELDEDPCISSAISSPEVPISILKARIAKGNEDEQDHWKQELRTLYLTRLLVHVVTRTLVNTVTESEEVATQIISNEATNITNWECYDRSVDIFHDMCFNLGQNPFALRVMTLLVNLCEHGYKAEQFLDAAESVCRHPKFTGIN